MQLAIVILVLLACAIYIGWRIRDEFRRPPNSPCHGCKGCALQDLKGRKPTRKERKMCPEAKK